MQGFFSCFSWTSIPGAQKKKMNSLAKQIKKDSGLVSFNNRVTASEAKAVPGELQDGF